MIVAEKCCGARKRDGEFVGINRLAEISGAARRKPGFLIYGEDVAFTIRHRDNIGNIHRRCHRLNNRLHIRGGQFRNHRRRRRNRRGAG
ncbi:MAG TPA: hypothetical protein VGS58_12825, partial [Candidatus Sulfopaludibacter sp.]|nr:hypothetical protein [Candidatus Sulfopaludibacter sp.]